MYTVMWEENGMIGWYRTDSWNEACKFYDGLYSNCMIQKLKIRDNKHGVFYKDYAWLAE